MLLNVEQDEITSVQYFLLVLQVYASGWALGKLPLFTLQIFFVAKISQFLVVEIYGKGLNKNTFFSFY